MKRNIFKSLLFLCSFMCLTAVFIFGVSAKEVTSGDFVFNVNGSTATVKEYTGTAKSVKIPSKVGSATVKAIGNEAFWSVKTMTSISIPSTVTSIGKAAFNECTGLKKVVIPSKVTKIGASAFWYCTNLKTVVIPESVTSIGTNAFKGCNSLTAYVVKGTLGESYVKNLSYVTLAYRYVDSVRLNKSSAKLEVGDSVKLSYTVSPDNVYSKKAKYSSSNKKVAAVSSDGTVTAVAPGSATITCKASDGSGKKDTVKITVTPEKVTGLRQTKTTATGYTLRWSKSEGATKYRIYRYNSKTNKWDTVKYTSGTSYKVTGRSLGSSQKYRILAYTSVSGTYYRAPVSATFTARPLYPHKVTGITAKPAHNFINLSWSKAANATGYNVYKYNAETKKYTFIKSTKKTSLKVSSLEPNTAYTFMVRAYMTYNKKTIDSSYSELVPCTTRPDYVTGLRVKENSVYVSKLTLQWDALSGVSGYTLSMFDEEKNAYVTFAAVDGSDVTEYTVDGLEPGTSYSFKIKSFVSSSGSVLYGYNCKTAVTATTNSRPANSEEAFDGFLEGYNTSKNSTADFALIMNTAVSDFEGENSESCSAIVEAVGTDESSILSFVGGIESVSKAPVTSFLSPKDAFSTLTFSQLSEGSVSFDDDGNGFRIRFSLPRESDGAINALITDTVDFAKIAEENEGFVLNSCTYEGTQISAKVHNGLIDDITVTVPIKVNFNIGDTTYEFSETITKEYMFIW